MFKRFLIWSSGGPPILREGIMWNIHVKLYMKYGSVVQEEMSF